MSGSPDPRSRSPPAWPAPARPARWTPRGAGARAGGGRAVLPGRRRPARARRCRRSSPTRCRRGRERPLALVVPHAGYVYSGQIAADALAAGAPGTTTTSSSSSAPTTRRAGFAGASVYAGAGLPHAARRGRGGPAAAARAAGGRRRLRRRRRAPHAREHSVEVQVPFAQVALAAACRSCRWSSAARTARLCARFGQRAGRARWPGAAPLVVASSDLSHYPAHDGRRARRPRGAGGDRAARPGGGGRGHRRADERAAAAGWRPAPAARARCMAAMAAARALGATRGVGASLRQQRRHARSATATRVVGYGAVAFDRGRPASDTRGPRAAGRAGAPTRRSTAADRALLLALRARDARALLRDRHGAAAARRAARGCGARRARSSRSRRHGELRGCIGHMADGPAAGARRSAPWRSRRRSRTRASRRSTRGELADVEIEISVLDAARARSPGPRTIVVGPRRRRCCARTAASAVFLPQVATEQGWDRDALLAQLCRKAGLPADAWRERRASFRRSRREVFGEPKPRAMIGAAGLSLGVAHAARPGGAAARVGGRRLRQRAGARAGRSACWLLGTRRRGRSPARALPRAAGRRSRRAVRAGRRAAAAGRRAGARGAAAARAACPAPTCRSRLQLAALALVLLPAALPGRRCSSRARAGSRPRAAAALAAAYAIESVGGAAGGRSPRVLPAARRAELRGRCCCAGAPARRPPGSPGRRAAGARPPPASPRARAARPSSRRGSTAPSPRWTHPDLLATRDTPYGRLTLDGARRPGRRLRQRRAGLREPGHRGRGVRRSWRRCSAPRPRRVLVLGGGGRGAGARAAAPRPARGGRRRARPGAAARCSRRGCRPAARRALADPRVRASSPTRAPCSRAPGGCDLILLGPARAGLRRRPTASTRASSSPPAPRASRPAGCWRCACAAAENLWTPALVRRTGERAPRRCARSSPTSSCCPARRTSSLASRAPLARDPERARRRGCARAARRAPRHAGLPALPLHERPLRRASRGGSARPPARGQPRRPPGLLPGHAGALAGALLPRAGRLDAGGGRATCSAPARLGAASVALLAASRWRGGAPRCGARCYAARRRASPAC